MSSQNSNLYCLCRSSDCSTFMIACDACNIWYHGICIGISEKESKRIEHFFCHQCRHKTPSLQIKYNRPQKEIEEKLSKYIVRRLHKEAKLLNPNINNERKYSTGNDTFTNEDSASNHSDSSSSSTNILSRKQQVLYGNSSATVHAEPAGPPKRTPMTKNAGHGDKRKRNISGSSLPLIKKEPKIESNDEEDTKTLSSRRGRKKTEPSRQCYGPGCPFEARSQSKYCSDKCGLELARNRLLQFLPMRLMQWQTIPSVLDVQNKNTIEDILIEKDQIRQRLTVLDDRQKKLDEIIEQGKQLQANRDSDKTETNNDEPDGMCFCVLCNQEISQKSYLRHIDKCFIRFESQVSYGSNVKSNIEGLFCDNYDRTNNLYCKRLKVICPEHSRDPKVGQDEACGCPLEKNLFEVSNELCTVPKRLCSKHFKWDRKRRAQIDLERLHELMRLEELIEKENRLRTALNERGSVAGLLLHKTVAY